MRNDGGQAFPVPAERVPVRLDEKGFPEYRLSPLPTLGGITVRDYFAGHALQALITRSKVADFITADYAEFAYACADAMMQERGK